MPRATTDKSITTHHPLETLEGGWVDLRKMTYGERIKVREMSMEIGMTGSRQASKSDTVEMTGSLHLSDVADFEFACSIIDHNLEDGNGQKLNFTKPGVVQSLDPAIGLEIDQLITDLNQGPKETS